MRPAILAAAFASLVAVGGCQTVQEHAGPCQKAPDPRAETIAKAPVAEFRQIWQPGHWDWDGRGYTWTEGVWVKAEGKGNLWMAGTWDRPVTPGACQWVPAHWM